jgi:hypothetical protein
MKKYNYRKYYKLGERLELNGKVIEVVEVVESSCACMNCCFMNEFFNVHCSSSCASGERPDGLSVCFRLVDMAKDNAKDNAKEYPPHDPDKEYAIYERFQYNGVVAECRECKLPFSCRDCVLYPCARDFNKCLAFSREDGISVYYKILDDVRP